jgi:hypothetical protein
VAEYGAQITSVKLERGPCFGRCPVYDVTLAADGAAVWNGERFVDRLGRFQGQVDLGDFGRLARFIQRAGFLGWDDEYVASVTDLPNYYLTVLADGQRKTVRQYGTDEPPDFWVIGQLVDCLAEAVDWTGTPPTGTCRDWIAIHDRQPPGPSRLTVRGTCTFPTAGFSVTLRRHEPQGINPRDLLLDRIEHPPTGPVALVVTDVEVTYSEETEVGYETVTIQPDGPSMPVTEAH